MWTGSPITAFLVATIAAFGTGSRGEEPAPAVRVDLVRPDLQLERLIALFDGLKAPHPAAALAAWRQATGRDDVLGKGTQAALAALNPSMIRELRTIDGARFALKFGTGGRPTWTLSIPHDDGTVSALATALALTDGRSEPPLQQGVVVDRLGGEGSPLLAQDGPAVALGPDREALVWGFALLAQPRIAGPDFDSGWMARIDPEALALASDQLVRRLGAGLVGLGSSRLEAKLALRDEVIRLEIVTSLQRRPPETPAPVIDPAWLAEVPAEGVLAAFGLAIEPGSGTVDRLFAAADRVEKSAGDRADSAPIRARLNLIANTAGVRPEVEIWPVLRGISGFARRDAADGGMSLAVSLHLSDEAAAERLGLRALPRLASRLAEVAEPGQAVPPTVTWSGRLAGRPAAIRRAGPTTVRIDWGSFDPIDREPKPGTWVDPTWLAMAGRPTTSRFLAVRPWLAMPTDSPLTEALQEAPPVIWTGGREGSVLRDVIRWTGLHATLARLLDRLPMETPNP